MRELVARGKADGFSRFVAKREHLPGGFIADHKAAGILENTAHPDLNTDVFTVLDVGHDFKVSIIVEMLLQAAVQTIARWVAMSNRANFPVFSIEYRVVSRV